MIYSREFLAPGAPCEINIDGKTMERVHQEMKNPNRFTFDSAAEHVYTLLLKKDCYPRFIRSDQYRNILAAGVQPLQKKWYDSTNFILYLFLYCSLLFFLTYLTSNSYLSPRISFSVYYFILYYNFFSSIFFYVGFLALAGKLKRKFLRLHLQLRLQLQLQLLLQRLLPFYNSMLLAVEEAVVNAGEAIGVSLDLLMSWPSVVFEIHRR